MATVQNIIDGAARKVGISSLSVTDITNALEALNNLIGTLGVESLSPYLVRESKTLTVNDPDYTIGSALADWNTERPLYIVSCYLRDANGYDYPVSIMNGMEYSKIIFKSTQARPEGVYYIPEYPLSKIIFDYYPDYAYTAYFEFRKGFLEYTSVNDTVTLPNEYKELLVYNLAVKIAEDNNIVLPQSVVSYAEYTKMLVSRMFEINKPPSEVDFDIPSVCSGTLNITTGV